VSTVFAFDTPGAKANYGGAEYFVSFGTTLAKILAEKQKDLLAYGYNADEVLAVHWRVTKTGVGLESRWDVVPVAPPQKGAVPLKRAFEVVLGWQPDRSQSAVANSPPQIYGQTAAPVPTREVYQPTVAPAQYVAPTAVPIPAPSVQVTAQSVPSQVAPVAPVQAPVAPVAPTPAPVPPPAPVTESIIEEKAEVKAAKTIKLTEGDLSLVGDINNAIARKLDTTLPDHDPTFKDRAAASIKKTLETKKVAKAKIEALMATVDGNFQIHPEAIQASA
jgi:hypothetical protein